MIIVEYGQVHDFFGAQGFLILRCLFGSALLNSSIVCGYFCNEIVVLEHKAHYFQFILPPIYSRIRLENTREGVK